MSEINRDICDPDNYIYLDPQEIHHYYMEYIFPETEKGECFIAALKQSPRYEMDACYKVVVDVLDLIQNYSTLMDESFITKCGDLLSVAWALELWFLVSHLWLVLGNAYTRMNMLERTIECYSRVIEIEKKYGLITLTPVAHSNLGLAYISMDYFEKAIVSLKKANEELEIKYTKGRRYQRKIADNTINLLYCYSRIEDFDQAREMYEKIQTFDMELVSAEISFHYALIRISYLFLLFSRQLCDFEECERALEEAREKIVELPDFNYARVLYNFVERCFHYKVDISLFEERVVEFISLYPSSYDMINYAISEQAINYYELKGEQDKLPALYKDYSEYVLKLVEQNRLSQRNSVDIVEAILINDAKNNEVRNENIELKMLYRESVESKKRLTEAYQRIELINELGCELTSTIDLNELIQSINNILKNHMDFDSFILFLTDAEKGVLRSLIFEYNGNLQPNIEIPLDSEESLNVRCYRSKKLMRVDGRVGTTYMPIPVKDSLVMRSAVYLPLIVNHSVIGVYTLQHRDNDVYKDKLNFLTDLTPYISIAINNALKSHNLEKEIESHIVTQSKLKEANLSLEKLSLVDGLTHISSRRFFEKKIQDMLMETEEKQNSLTMLMIDIDNFKMYNDTYGHLEGDKALQAVASVFKEEMEKVKGLSARFGGEEFVGAATHLSLEESAELGERIRSAIYELKMENRGTQLGFLTVSIGLAYGRGLGVDAKSSIMRMADEMLYKAKNSGKNRIFIQDCSEEA